MFGKVLINQKNRAFAIGNNITNIGDIAICLRFVIEVSVFYNRKMCMSISYSSPKIWPKRGFLDLLRSVGHLESNLDQN